MKQKEIENFTLRKKTMKSQEFTLMMTELFGKNRLNMAKYLGITWRQVYNYENGKTAIPNPVALCLHQKKILDRIPKSWINKYN